MKTTKTTQFAITLLLAFAIMPFVSGAHWIVGTFNGDANGKTVYLYNPVIGIQNNISDIVGITGASNADNMYMLDVEMLYSCAVGDEVRITLDGINYVPVIISGAGYDVAPNLNLSENVTPTTNLTNTTISLNETNNTIISPINNTNITDVNNTIAPTQNTTTNNTISNLKNPKKKVSTRSLRWKII